MSNPKEQTPPKQRWIPKKMLGMIRRNRRSTDESSRSEDTSECEIERHRQSLRPSTISSGSRSPESREDPPSSFVLHDNGNTNNLDSNSMLAKLGKSPSHVELANLAAVRANECINERVFGAVSAEGVCNSQGVDRRKWESTPQYYKSDLLIGKYLGKGSFSDVFEVHVTVIAVEKTTPDSSDNDKFDGHTQIKIDAKIISEEGKEDIGDDLDAQINAGDEANNKKLIVEKRKNQPKVQDCSEVPDRKASSSSMGLSSGNARRAPRRHQSDVTSSLCIRTLAPVKENQVTYAMKCLRPHVRSNAEQLVMGIEDLVHETAMLAGLDHPHIIKVHGRAGNAEAANKSLSKLFPINDGYFILLDRLQDTLESRITSWKKIDMGDGSAGKRRKSMPSSSQLKTACSIADALSYLFSKGVIFRDLKPANVGFDARGVLKLFDFGFAIEVDTVNDNTEHVRGVCGTQRYMAPENGLGLGYSFPADVYSFGILLWEICSLKKPFAHIKSPGEFRRSVFEKGDRPKLRKCWPRVIKDTIAGCWCSEPGKRPRMDGVSALLNAHVKDMQEHNSTGSLRKSSLLQRIQR